MRKICFNSCILFFFLVTNSCSNQRQFVEIEYKGIVYDATQSTPVKNCLVKLEAKKANEFSNGVQYFEIRRIYTKDDGSFEIKDQAARSNQYRISFSRDGITRNLRFENLKGKDLKSEKYRFIYL